MVNEARRRTLGICLDENTVRLAEVERTAGRYKVLNTTEVPARPAFSLNTLNDSDALDQLGRNLHNIIAERGFSPEEAFAAVNARFALLKRVPYDASLSQRELQEHVAWELNQYIISPLEEYNFDFQEFSKHANADHPTMLFVAIRKKVTEALESVFQNLEIPLQLVTIDLLAMANAIEYNYKFAPEEKIAVVEICAENITFAIIEGDRFLGYNSIPLGEICEGESIQDADPNTIGSYIQKQLRFLFSDYWSEDEQSTFDHVLVTRNSSRIRLDTITALPEQEALQIIQPFRNISLAESLQRSLDAGTIMAEYAGAIGVTLRE